MLTTEPESIFQCHFSSPIPQAAVNPGEWEKKKILLGANGKDEYLACSVKVSSPSSSNSLEIKALITCAHSAYQLLDNSRWYLLKAQKKNPQLKKSAMVPFSFWFAKDIPMTAHAQELSKQLLSKS